MAQRLVKRTAENDAVEGPWTLPEEWRWASLASVASSTGGGRLTLNKSHYAEEGYPAFSAAGQDGFVSEWEFEGDAVVLSSIGARCGKSFYATGRWTSLANTQCIFPSEALNARYLWYFSNDEERWERSGSAQPFIKHATIKALKVPLPPLDIQRRIVSRLDDLFNEIDDGEAALERARTDLATWHKALLKAAVTGELTADWRATNPTIETGADLLARIRLRERDRHEARGSAKKQIDLAQAAEPFLLPPGWAWSQVGEVASDTLIGLDRSAELQSQNPLHAPYIKMADISMGGSVRTSANMRVPVNSDELKRFALREGDILFNTRNSLELVGKTGLVRTISEISVYNNNLMRLRLHPEIKPQFAVLWMCSPPFRKQLEAVKRATTSVAAVYGKDLFQLPIPVPPANEQAAIVQQHARFADEFSDIPPASAALRQSILAAAFRGELVA